MTDSRPLLVVRHVTWEGPHRILDAFEGRPVVEVDILSAGATLPGVDEVSAALFMGGPMSVNDTADHPALGDELAWIARAIEHEVPVLGICLGSQLIAKALGAEVRAGAQKELGWAPVTLTPDGESDPLLGALAPTQTVLHWHGEVFDLPPGATLLASSELTACQAFRAGSAWATLFHAEADADLVDVWLAEQTMAAEAREVIGDEGLARLRTDAEAAGPALFPASRAMFAAFAERVAAPTR